MALGSLPTLGSDFGLGTGPTSTTSSSSDGGFDWLGAVDIVTDILGRGSDREPASYEPSYGARPSYVDSTANRMDAILRLALESFKTPQSLI
jgi:hypothetical protein